MTFKFDTIYNFNTIYNFDIIYNFDTLYFIYINIINQIVNRVSLLIPEFGILSRFDHVEPAGTPKWGYRR